MCESSPARLKVMLLSSSAHDKVFYSPGVSGLHCSPRPLGKQSVCELIGVTCTPVTSKKLVSAVAWMFAQDPLAHYSSRSRNASRNATFISDFRLNKFAFSSGFCCHESIVRALLFLHHGENISFYWRSLILRVYSLHLQSSSSSSHQSILLLRTQTVPNITHSDCARKREKWTKLKLINSQNRKTKD